MMGGRSCNNIRSRGRKKSKGSVVAIAAVTVIVMTTTTIRTATIVKAHDQPSGVGCLPYIAIPPQSADASVAFNGVIIAGVPVQTQLERSLSLSCGDRLRSERSLNHSSSDNEEPTSNTTAEYQEWPMRGFFKRTMIDTTVWTSA
jgi:hypothetical protein